MYRIDLIHTEGARVARISLEPGEISPRHYHSNVIENVVCLSGVIEIKLDGSSELKKLLPGQIYEISPLVAHHLINTSDLNSEYLLVQKGSYDFVSINA